MIPALVVAAVLSAQPVQCSTDSECAAKYGGTGGPVPVEACTETERAAYVARGFHPSWCELDKTTLGDTDPGKFDADTCGETDEGCEEVQP